MPYCYLCLVNWKECNRNPILVIIDLWYIFFKMKSFPDFYSPCRLWEKDREYWKYYYGSTYDAYQKYKISLEVSPPEYKIMFDDKEISQEICELKNIPIAKSYGVIDPKEDFRLKIAEIFKNGISKDIIIKPTRGHAGIGIKLARVIKNDIVIIEPEGNTSLLSLFNLKDRSILQEVVEQTTIMASVSPFSVNTIRTVTLLKKDGNVLMVGAHMRFSMKESFIDNWSAGGLAVGVNLKNGSLVKYAFDKYGNRYEKHPISGIYFGNFKIPRWNSIHTFALEIQSQFPYFKMLGLDIAITQNGPVLLEINSDPDNILLEQTYGPILKNERVKEAFKEYNLLVNNLRF
jgi:glutathione synthase/RimK-type ligase-like ATP-grasp enzyme